MTETTNEAEAIVYRMCRHSFLSLWSYKNPRQNLDGKELCDVLVVCEPDVIIFSIKQIRLADSGRREIDAERWRRRAVSESMKQVYGAQRVLRRVASVVRSDNSLGVRLPDASEIRIHRVAVALGGERKVDLPFGDFGKGFVHVMDEKAFMTLLDELDTITDFVDYLAAKEAFCQSGIRTRFHGPEENLLAIYLHAGRKFPDNHDVVILGDDLWKQFAKKKEYQRKRKANEDSYIWDRLIEHFCQDFASGQLEFAPGDSETERAIRTIARENRFARRVLGRDFKQFLDQSRSIRSRMMKSPSGMVYVFLACPHGTPRKLRVAELGLRCFVARGLHLEDTKVVGIATEQYEKGRGFSLDLHNLFKPKWSAEDQKRLEDIQRDLGYFKNPKVTKDSEDEYPDA